MVKFAHAFPTRSIHEVSLPFLSILRNEITNCDSTEFELVAVPCFNHLIKIIQCSSQSHPLIYSSCKILVDILQFSANQPSLFREFSTSHVPNLLSMILSLIDKEFYPGFFIILEAILQSYPGCASHQAGKIEKAVLRNVDNSSESLDLKLLAHCFVCLPFIGQVSKREMRWSEFLNKSCASLASFINYYFDKLGMNCDLEFFNERKFSYSTISADDQDALKRVKRRFEFGLYCLSSVLLNGSVSPLKFDFTKILRCFDAFLSINVSKLMISSASSAHENIQMNILSLHVQFCRLVKIMYECVESNLFVYNFQVMNILLRQLNWTKPSVRKPHFEDSLSHYRSELLETMDSVIANSSELCLDVIYFNRVALIDHLLHDVSIVFNAESHYGRIDVSNHSNNKMLQSNKIRKSVHSTSRKKVKQFLKATVDLDSNSPCLTAIKVNDAAYVKTSVMAWRVLTKLIAVLFNNSTSLDNGSSNSASNLWQKLTWKLESILAILSSSPLETVLPYSNEDVFSEFLNFLEYYCLLQLRNMSCSISFSSIRCFLLHCTLHHYDSGIKFNAHNILKHLDASIGSWTPRLCQYQSGKVSECLSSDVIDNLQTANDEIKTVDEIMIHDETHEFNHSEENNVFSLSEIDQGSIETKFIQLSDSNEIETVPEIQQTRDLSRELCNKRCSVVSVGDGDLSVPSSKKSKTTNICPSVSNTDSTSTGNNHNQVSVKSSNEIHPMNNTTILLKNETKSNGLSVSEMLQSFVHTFE